MPVESFFDELCKHAAITLFDDDVDVTMNVPVGHLLIHEKPRSYTTLRRGFSSLARADVNMVSNLRQQNQIGCVVDLDGDERSVIARPCFAIGAILIID